MKVKIIVIMSLMIIGFSAKAQKGKSHNPDFKEFIEICNLSFALPDGFHSVKVKKNKDVIYDYAMKDDETGVEMRYVINSFEKNFYGIIDTTSFNPNKMTRSFFTSAILNASGNVLPNIPEIEFLDHNLVKFDLGGDKAATSMFLLNSDFGKGFTHCLAMVVEKDNVGLFMIFWMFDGEPGEKINVVKHTANALKFNL